MKIDALIKNGRVIDPYRGVDCIGDVYLKAGRVVDKPEEAFDATYTMDASGCIVVPGLIDFHEHINFQMTDVGIPADLATLPKGVTTVVDCGSSGATNCLAFLNRLSSLVVKSRIYIHISPLGLATQQFYEPLVPEKWDLDKIAYAFYKGGDKIRGIKMRVSNYVLKDGNMEPFFEMLKVARRFNKTVLIHPSDPPVHQAVILNALQAGDVYCHVFQEKGWNIIENGELIPEVLAARERGVIFDIAHGGANFSFQVAEKAIQQGFLPDMISTDTTKKTWNKKPICNLPYVMSKFLQMGLKLNDVIRCVTATPAINLGMEGEIGTLAPGACGDVAVLKLVDGEFSFPDAMKNTRNGKQLLVPISTFSDGELVWQDAMYSALN